jgi:hypothetical protein
MAAPLEIDRHEAQHFKSQNAHYPPCAATSNERYTILMATDEGRVLQSRPT